MMRTRIAALATLLVLPTVALAEESEITNHCKDPESAKEWRELARDNPHDDAIQRLHALRMGICKKVERGNMTVKRGTLIFERQRQKVIAEKKRKKEAAGPSEI